jgi:hypothetical protein
MTGRGKPCRSKPRRSARPTSSRASRRAPGKSRCERRPANLISNGFYAATKRKQQDNSEGYEPALTASTKDLDDRVEIRIRDNGTGIPTEVRDKMFNPFAAMQRLNILVLPRPMEFGSACHI